MKYLSIQDEDYEKVNKLLKDNDIKFREQEPIKHFVEERIMLMYDDTDIIDERVDFVVEQINPLDMDLLINQALLIYESEDDDE